MMKIKNKNENLNTITYLTVIMLFYIIMNFIVFEFSTISEAEYLFLIILNVSVCIFFSVAAESNDTLSIKIGKHFAILLACLWIIGYEFFIAQEYTTKMTGISMFIGGSSLMFLLTRGAWPFTSVEGKLYLEKYKLYCITLIIMLLVLIVVSVSILLFGEWVFRG